MVQLVHEVARILSFKKVNINRQIKNNLVNAVIRKILKLKIAKKPTYRKGPRFTKITLYLTYQKFNIQKNYKNIAEISF